MHWSESGGSRGLRVQEVLASHAEMVSAVWAWLTRAGAGGPADGSPGGPRSIAHTAMQARVACARVAYALVEGNFGPVKVMHAAPACFDGALAAACCRAASAGVLQ